MTANLLTLSSSKTEFLLIALKKQLDKIHNCSRNTTHSARNLGFSSLINTLPFWATVCKTVRPMLSVRCLSVLSCPVCDVRALWPNGSTDQDETWHAGRPRPWPHCVRWGPSYPSPKGHTPNFRPISVAAKWLHGSRCHLVWS